MVARAHKRLLIRVVGGADYLQILAVAGIATVLITRAFLALSGYPQVGGGGLHIAHVLWGGLLMLVALVTALLFVGRAAKDCVAFIGGVGLGLFVDEVGKFVTRTNDYFYRPAASIIYLVFAALLVLTSLVRAERLTTPEQRVVNAAEIAVVGLGSGLTPRQRTLARHLLGRSDAPDERSAAVARLLELAPDRPDPLEHNRLIRRTTALLRTLVEHRWFVIALVVVYVFQAVVVGIVFLVQALLLVTGHPVAANADRGAIIASAFTTNITSALAVTGALLLRRGTRTEAFGFLKAATLFALLVTQVFNFTDSQFRALAALPFELLALGVFSYQLRRLRRHPPA